MGRSEPRPRPRAKGEPERPVVVIASCQGHLLCKALRLLAPGLQVEHVHTGTLQSPDGVEALAGRLAEFDSVFTVPLGDERFGAVGYPVIRERHPCVEMFPTISFQGYHPDCVYVGNGKVKSPIGGYHSALVLLGYLEGLRAKETCSLFNRDVYRSAGYFDEYQASRGALLHRLGVMSEPMQGVLARWERRGAFMHTINHPRLFVLVDLARALLRAVGAPLAPIDPELHLVDNFPDGEVWPVYPEIASRFGIAGELYFKRDKKLIAAGRSTVVDLETFVDESFEIYSEAAREDLVTPRLEDGRFRAAVPVDRYRRRFWRIRWRWAGKRGARDPGTMANPYSDRPDHCFWRRSVAGVAAPDLDPVVAGRRLVSRADLIATAGSCFAQHIARRLEGSGYAYLVAEPKPPEMPDADPRAETYGVYSCRYGNVYTARQLVQLFERAFGSFQPADVAWRRAGDGRFVDPFRPHVEPGGFDDEKAVVAERDAHLGAVRRMFETLDVFVFTLGLTEGWRSRLDGAVFPIAPGVAGSPASPEAYEFVNFDAASVTADLARFLSLLRGVNPAARAILTVSPVPLVATYENRHVLVSTTLSKSVLRVAADETARRERDVVYFPSYEIVTGNYNRGAYFADDLRSVTTEGVDHVMRVFLAHCEDGPESAAAGIAAPAAAGASDSAERAAVEAVICDEEALDP